MTFTATNNAKGEVLGGLGSGSTTLNLKSGQGALFPATGPFRVTLEKIVEGEVTQREIVEASSRSGDVLTISRAVEACPSSDVATTQTSTAFSFDDGDLVSLYFTAGLNSSVNTELERLEDDKLDKQTLRDGLTANSILFIDDNGDEQEVALGTTGQVLQSAGVDQAPEFADFTNIVLFENLFGDGSDGNVTISTNTTLTEDKYYDNLTVNSGIILNTGGYRVYVRGTLTNNGTIERNGNNGGNATFSAGGSGGAALSNGTTGGSAGGGSGSGSSTAGNGGSITGIGGGDGGDGGFRASTTGGTTTKQNSVIGFTPKEYVANDTEVNFQSSPLYSLMRQDTSAQTFLLNGGSGGGGGGGSGAFSAYGGGGGSGGGVVYLQALTITNNGTIRANGGNGGNGTGSFGEGGAGGGGGVVCLIYGTLTAGTIEVNGGSGGSGQPSSDPGTAGSILKIKVA